MKLNKLVTNITRYTSICAIVLLVSCVSNEIMEKSVFEDDPNAINIKTSIYSSLKQARADVQTFNPGDRITVRKTLTGEESIYQLANDGKSWSPLSSSIYLRWEGGTNNSFQAWNQSGYSSFTLPTDQSTTDELEKADWLTAQETIAGSVPNDRKLNLTFHHRMAKVVLSFVGGDDTFTTTTPGRIHQVRINSAHGSWEDSGDNKLTAVTPFSKIDTGNEIKITSKEVSEGDTKVTALLFPTDQLSDKVFLMLSLNFPGDSEGASARFAQVTGIPQLKEGIEYHFTVEVSSGRVAVIAISEGEWNDGGELPSDGGNALDMPIGYIGTAEGLLEYAKTHDMTDKVARLTDMNWTKIRSTAPENTIITERLYNARERIGWIEIVDNEYITSSVGYNQEVPYLYFPNMKSPASGGDWRYDNFTGICFPQLTSLQRWTFNATALIFETVIFRKLESLDVTFTQSNKIQYLSIPSVAKFEKEEFLDCSNLKEIYAPALQLVENDAFSGCQSLKKLTVAINTVAINNNEPLIVVGKIADKYAAWITADCELIIGTESDEETPIKAWKPRNDYTADIEYGENELKSYAPADDDIKDIKDGLAGLSQIVTEEQIRQRCVGCPVFAGFPWKSISVQLPDGTEVKRFDKIINN